MLVFIFLHKIKCVPMPRREAGKNEKLFFCRQMVERDGTGTGFGTGL